MAFHIDYEKIDPIIKKGGPDLAYQDFIKANPKMKISVWSFAKRKATILGLPMTPSMKAGYRSKKGSAGTSENDLNIDRRTRSIYTNVFSMPIQELKEKNGVDAVSFFIETLNKIFKLNLESAQVEVIGSGVKNFEIRRYNK